MRLLRWLALFLIALLAMVVVVIVAARSADGPLGLLAGGPLVTGELVSGESDWAFARDVPTIEFQLVEPPRSRTTWILEHDGKVYIPCGYMDSWLGRQWKRWPIEAERDGRAIIRIGGNRYERRLVRIKQGPVVAALTGELNRKYGVPVTPELVANDSLWLFELAPPR